MICTSIRKHGTPVALAWALFALAASAQTVSGIDAITVFHPAGPLPSYDVATIKPADPAVPWAGTTLRNYISRAYGVPIGWGMPGSDPEAARVVGGPGWLDKDRYEIRGKPAEDLRDAMQTMTREQRLAQEESMQQALLAERFHLKVHFETRDMRVLELVPAKGGLKITPVDAPPEGGSMTPMKPGDPLPPGMTRLSTWTNGAHVLDARSTTVEAFISAMMGQAPEIAGRPVVDKTGFRGHFDIKGFRFAGAAPPESGDGARAKDPDAPSFVSALEETLGMKLVPARGKVEIVVIDSIERPSEN
ncbi:MAG: TIGR03435 family protein [Acidobacteriota bacterium]|nr:TIGR03435 family protein [Acidobacteriota bacterium]